MQSIKMKPSEFGITHLITLEKYIDILDSKKGVTPIKWELVKAYKELLQRKFDRGMIKGEGRIFEGRYARDSNGDYIINNYFVSKRKDTLKDVAEATGNNPMEIVLTN